MSQINALCVHCASLSYITFNTCAKLRQHAPAAYLVMTIVPSGCRRTPRYKDRTQVSLAAFLQPLTGTRSVLIRTPDRPHKIIQVSDVHDKPGCGTEHEAECNGVSVSDKKSTNLTKRHTFGVFL